LMERGEIKEGRVSLVDAFDVCLSFE